MMLRAIMTYGIQWNLSNLDTNGAGESVIVSEVRGILISEVEMHARVVLGWEKVSCLERCPQFRSVLIYRERGSIRCVCDHDHFCNNNWLSVGVRRGSRS